MKYTFHHLHLVCSDLEQMIAFFTDTLGAGLVAARKLGNADGAMLDLTGVPVWLRGLRPGEEIDGESRKKRFGYDHIGVAVENLYEAYLELVAKGVSFTMPPRTGRPKSRSSKVPITSRLSSSSPRVCPDTPPAQGSYSDRRLAMPVIRSGMATPRLHITRKEAPVDETSG